MTVADLRRETASAAADAVAGATAGEGTATPEATPDPSTATPAASAGGTSEVSGTQPGETAEGTPPEGEATEVPTEYMGFEFPPDMTPEQRADILGQLTKRDDIIGKLLREREPAAPSASETPPPPPAEELSDEAILKQLGLDPENSPLDEVAAKVAVPLVRRQVQQDQALASLIELSELHELDRTWRDGLSGMEKEFGALPKELDHDRVMEFAAENGISNPMDAYWRVVGPARQVLTSATKAVRDKALADAKRGSTATRPGTGAAEGDAPIESKTAKGATGEVARRLLAELGL